jgi:RNA polymerase sigma factor (sigma-70 family)
VAQERMGSVTAVPQPRAESSIDDEFRDFFNTNYRPLLSFATFWGKSHDDADEAVGSVMAYIHKRWTRIQDPVAYARRAVPRTILKIRRDRRDDRHVLAPEPHLPDGGYTVCEFDLLEGEQWVDDLLSELPPIQYAVLRRYLDGLSMKEISDELHKSESAIRQNYKLARDRLRPLVTEYDRRKPRPSDERTTREDNR